MAGRYDPGVVETVLNAWGEAETDWPSWGKLKALLDDASQPPPQLVLSSPGGGSGEKYSVRCGRLGITAKREQKVGMRFWSEIMDHHHLLTDDEILHAFERLERGLAAFPNGPPARRHSRKALTTAEAIALLDDDSKWNDDSEPGEWKRAFHVDHDRLRSLAVTMGVKGIPAHWKKLP